MSVRIGTIRWKAEWLLKTFPIGSRVLFTGSSGYTKIGIVTGYGWLVSLNTFQPYFEPIVSWDKKSIVFVDGPCDPRYLTVV